MGIGVSLFLFAVLILFSAFFVATEFAIIKIRSSRVDQLVVENRKNALALQRSSIIWTATCPPVSLVLRLQRWDSAGSVNRP